MDLLFALREQRGTTLLLITHDPALAAALRPHRPHRRRPGGGVMGGMGKQGQGAGPA